MTTSATNSDLTDEEEQFQNMKVWPLEESVGKEIPLAEGLYFSDLTEEKLMTLFCKSPSFRYELCTVYIKCKIFSKRPKMYGFIQAAECPSPTGGCFSSDMASSSHYVFNRESNDPIVVRDCSLFLDHIYCSVPASNYIQISAKLYVKAATKKETEEEDEEENEEEENEEEEEEEYVVKEDGPPLLENEMVKLFKYFTFYTDGSMTLKSKDVVENDSEYDMEVYKELEERNLNIPPDNIPEAIDLDEDEPFEVCDGNLVINLSDGCAGSSILIGNGGSLNLYYVALKYAVDAVIELEFDVHSKDIKLNGYIKAFYGNKFDYGCRHDKKNLYTPRLFDIRPHVFVKSGKLNMLRSVLAVPAQFSLIIDVKIRDDLTRKYILWGPYEFFVPLNGGSSYRSIVGNDLTLRMKVDWKLPF